MINFNHLYYFYCTVRFGGVSGAARKLHVSQPALSTQIKCLEASFGEALFTRHGRRLQVTERGKRVFEYASQMFELSEKMMDEIRAHAAPGEVRLHLGVADDIERPFSVRLVSLLLNRKENAESPSVTLACASHDALARKLEDGTIDALLSDRPAGGGACEALGTYAMPVMLAVAPKKLRQLGISTDPERALRTLCQHLVVPAPRFRLRREIDEFLRERGLRAHVSLESDLLASVVRAVVDGVGAGFLPLPYVGEAAARREIILFGPREGFWPHELWLLARKGGRQGHPILAKLKEAFTELVRDLPMAA